MDNNIFIHASAEVSGQANIGSGSKIWNLVQIRENCNIGNDCILSKNVYIDFGVNIGNRVKIQNNVSVYHGVTIEDDVFVGPCVVFTNDFRPRAVAPDWEVTETLVQQGASLGANCTLVCGITVGRHAMVAAGSVVTRSVPDNVLVAGNPAKPIGWVYDDGNKVQPDHVKGVEGEQVAYQNPADGQVLLLNKQDISLRPRQA